MEGGDFSQPSKAKFISPSSDTIRQNLRNASEIYSRGRANKFVREGGDRAPLPVEPFYLFYSAATSWAAPIHSPPARTFPTTSPLNLLRRILRKDPAPCLTSCRRARMRGPRVSP